jgi:cytochrome c oxidase cbb3-type subunit 4
MVSGLITLALLLLFVGGWIWAWNPRRKRVFDEAARLPLDDGEGAASVAKATDSELPGAAEMDEGDNGTGTGTRR